ncbi:unnamed protein product [Cladocopium goreaui]|uniref:EF-hand domain-containing protein n=1 Tax=Cladocopium goreaui TaxID=2562237 RepID=A0A9P1D2K3_9DINO|nr:unnamed protein product [Cladocopium goreaui]
MDSHVQATLSVQISGTKRWRLMPLRQRQAPFLAMIYADGQPYENPEGWTPLFDITLQPGDGLFFPPGMVHETKNVGEACAASVTFQFNEPTFFPRVRFTADIGESWVIIRDWARLGMAGDEKGTGESYEKARQNKDLEKHFQKLDKDRSGSVTSEELQGLPSPSSELQGLPSPSSALAWHDANRDKSISLEEFREGFAFWAAVTQLAVKSTPKEWRKFQFIGTVENLEDIPSHLSKKMRKEWEEADDQDKEAVKVLNDMWSTQVKEWMENSLGASYSERTYTKKIQDHVAALMGMPWEMDKDRHCLMIKLEHILIPTPTQRTSCREKIVKELDGKMLFVTVLYEDEDFSTDLAPDRTSPFGRIEVLTKKKLEELMAQGDVDDTPKAGSEFGKAATQEGEEALGSVSGGETPDVKKSKSHASFRPNQGKLSRFLAPPTVVVKTGNHMLWICGHHPAMLGPWGFICEHDQEFKVPIPATVSKFKLMVWFQNEEKSRPTDKEGLWTEELLGLS